MSLAANVARRLKDCERCGAPFRRTSNRSKWCSTECKFGTAFCEECGTEFQLSKNSVGRFCSHKCHGDNMSPVGSTVPHGEGYVLIKVPEGTPGVKVRSRWMYEHRYVMQLVLGRPLEAHERVHHKDGVRHHNWEENLELWRTAGHPSGVREGDYHCPGCRCSQ